MQQRQGMNREQQLYLEFGRVWSNENGDTFRRAMTLMADKPDMPIPDVVRSVMREKTSENRRSSMAVDGGGFLMNAGFSSRISTNPMQNTGGVSSGPKVGAVTSDGIHPAFVPAE